MKSNRKTPLNVVPNLSEARRLLDVGMRLVRLHPMSKRPLGNDWNSPQSAVRQIDPTATGYGLLLGANNLCSVDPDNSEGAKRIFSSWGLDFEKIMSAGVRTRSTRPRSGGRSTFHGEPGLVWIRIRTKELGVILELRANSSNLQDVIPGVAYYDKDGNVCTQEYVGHHRLDDPPPLPDELFELWERASTDIEFLHELERLAADALEDEPLLSVSNGLAKPQLAFSAPGIRSRFNSINKVEDFLERWGYEWHPREKRWSSPNSTGAPGIRPIPGRDGLWQSDHASDPLCGTFDAWSAYVQLDHGGDLEAAISAFEETDFSRALEDFSVQVVDPTTGAYQSAGERSIDSLKNAEPRMHPLATFLDLNYTPRLPEFVVDDFIGLGLTVIAGQPGVGKTSCLLPLASAVAHLCGAENALRPCIQRHVIWITEDVDQVERCLTALIKKGWATAEQFRQWFHVVAATRMRPSDIARVAPFYVSNLSNIVKPPDGDEMLVKPLVVFDTSNAVIDVDNENDNAEIGKAIARIKEAFSGFPVWLIAHVAKSTFGSNVNEMTSRGASAWGADANQTCFLVKQDDGSRYLKRGKSRFESKWESIRFQSTTEMFPVLTPFGLKEVPLRHAEGQFLEVGEGRAILEEAKKEEQRARDAHTRGQILRLVRENFAAGVPLNKASLKLLIGGNAQHFSDLIQSMISEGWLLEFELSKSALKRLGLDGRKRFMLVALEEGEFAEYLMSKVIPISVQRRIEALKVDL